MVGGVKRCGGICAECSVLSAQWAHRGDEGISECKNYPRGHDQAAAGFESILPSGVRLIKPIDSPVRFTVSLYYYSGAARRKWVSTECHEC